jgi:ferrochelatase
VGLVLTPHQSSLGSGQYLRRADEAASNTTPPLPFTPIPSWHRAPGLAELLAARTRRTLSGLPAGDRREISVFFTAHSLPAQALTDDDPYPAQIHQSAADIARVAGLDTVDGLTWSVAFQSPGRTDDAWLGPDLLGEIRRVADRGATAVVVCPVGFVSDHLEILYDLDIEAASVATSRGLAFARTPSLNDDPRFLDLLADVVVASVSAPSPGSMQVPTPAAAPAPTPGSAPTSTPA